MCLLTIAVPSYSDPQMLRKTLENLAEIPASLDVEVLVADNFSPDESLQVLAEFDPRLKVPYRYVRHPQNLGFGGNLAWLADNAVSTYVWFLGVGESIDLRLLPELIKVLGSENFKFGTVSGQVALSQGIQTRESPRFEVKTSGQRHDIAIYSETISLNIFSVELVRSAVCNGLISGDWWPHVEFALHAFDLEKAPLHFQVVTDCVSISPNHDGWWFEKEAAYLGAWKQIEVLHRKAIPAKSSIWLRRRKSFLRRRWIGAIYLKIRQNGHQVDRAFMSQMERLVGFSVVEILLLRLAILTPLGIFRWLAPIARRIGL